MRWGLILSDPEENKAKRLRAEVLLAMQQIPLSGFTQEPVCPQDWEDRNAFLRRAARTLLRPGEPLPLEAVLKHLSGDALPGNVLRKYVCLQLSLLPHLRKNAQVREGEGYFSLGDDLLVAPVSDMDTVDAMLPPGRWTDIQDGQVWQSRLRLMRGYNAMPILARENALIPIGVEDRRWDGDDADRLTLHWYQPGDAAQCILADGTVYAVTMQEGQPMVTTDATKPWHLIVHQDGLERLIC